MVVKNYPKLQKSYSLFDYKKTKELYFLTNFIFYFVEFSYITVLKQFLKHDLDVLKHTCYLHYYFWSQLTINCYCLIVEFIRHLQRTFLKNWRTKESHVAKTIKLGWSILLVNNNTWKCSWYTLSIKKTIEFNLINKH